MIDMSLCHKGLWTGEFIKIQKIGFREEIIIIYLYIILL